MAKHTETADQITAAELAELRRKAAAYDRKKVVRKWCVVRLKDYAITALHADEDGDPDTFGVLNHRLWVTTDREAAFQEARTHNALLCSVEGLPEVRGVTDLHKRLAIDAEADKDTEELDS